MSQKLRTLDLFAGIGGFSLGLERTGGFETVAFCEIEPYPQKVLAKHWPGVPIYEDVRQLTAERLATDGIGVDVITGGFPCQDISTAGNQAGIAEGTRSGLWSECARLLGELRPRYAIFENVTALLSGNNGRWFEQVLWDISQVGYDAEWHCIPASELGAHHHRDRVWIIAYPTVKSGGANAGAQSSTSYERQELQQENRQALSGDAGSLCEDVAHSPGSELTISIDAGEPKGSCEASPKGAGCAGRKGCSDDLADPDSLAGGKRTLSTQWRGWSASENTIMHSIRGRSTGNDVWLSEPAVGRVANGVPAKSHRLKALGNAVVPQIPELIGRAILESEVRA